ncbi:hypothetical protein [Fundidesulfovibrio magnetotacticus]|nr:hypothetical protein [Fundidesulfovibrio magnetotacticus]
MAEDNLYKPVEYVNAAQPGPTVLVLPGQVSAWSYEFLGKVNAQGLRDFAEVEMGKCNFKVLDRVENPAMLQEVAIAANLGEGAVIGKFKKFKFTPPHWVVVFDVIEVTPRSTGFKYTDKAMAGLAGSLMGGMIFGQLGAKIGEATLGSISSAEEQREWAISLRYRVIDAVSGVTAHEGQFQDKTTVYREIKGFMGFDTHEAGGGQLSTSVQRMVQQAIREIDEKHKLPAMAAFEAEKAKREKAIARAAAEKPAPPAKKGKKDEAPVAEGVACTMTSLGAVSCLVPTGWTTAAFPTLGAQGQAQALGGGGQSSALAMSLATQAAGPLVTLTMPGSVLGTAFSGVAINGPDVDGRLIMVPAQACKGDPAVLQAMLEKHFQQSSLVQGLGVETVEAQGGQRPIQVYKYIRVERRKVESNEPQTTSGADTGQGNSKMVSVPHYLNIAVAVMPKGDQMVVALLMVPEERFVPQLEGFRKLVGSIS